MSKYVIDIFSDNPTVTLDYMIAVMQAKRDNPDWLVQCKKYTTISESLFMDVEAPHWRWEDQIYRMHPKHRDEYTNKSYAKIRQWLPCTPNGKVFTEESPAGKRVFIRQTGSTKWIEWKPAPKILDLCAIKAANPGWEFAIAGKDLPMPPTDKELEEHGLEMTWECRNGEPGEYWWSESLRAVVCGYDAEQTGMRWILKHKDKRRVPLTMEDLPPVFWVKEGIAWRGVNSISSAGIRISYEECSAFYNYCDLFEEGFVYSVDRKEIKPFYKEV